MITRIWRARATPEGAERYRAHFERTVLPSLTCLNGFRKAYLLFREQDDTVDIEVHTVWNSLDDIRAFAGPDLTVAVVEQEARDAVLTFDTTVQHFLTHEYNRDQTNSRS